MVMRMIICPKEAAKERMRELTMKSKWVRENWMDGSNSPDHRRVVKLISPEHRLT